MNAESSKIDIKSLSRKQLITWLEKNGEKRFRADQIFKWVYQHQNDDFKSMNNLNKKLRTFLEETFTIRRLEIISVQTSVDGSKKYAFSLQDHNIIETLLIPEKNHFTLCVSSQIGCAQQCKFCLTGKSGLVRNLSSDEIIAQVRDIQKKIIDQSQIALLNVVFMGMGEPLANYKEVIKAVKIISDGNIGLKISSRRITISTVGLAPKIKLLGLETNANLAVSLNASDNATRNVIMPINRIYPIEVLINACQHYSLAKRQRITFEYVLIKGINDAKTDAKRLAILLKNTQAKINLIPFNEHTGCEYERPCKSNILSFQKYLIMKKYTVIIRHSKGGDISGACGQLRANYQITPIK